MGTRAKQRKRSNSNSRRTQATPLATIIPLNPTRAVPTLPGLAELNPRLGDAVWQQFGYQADPMAMFAQWVKKTPGIAEELWEAWSMAKAQYGTSQVIGLFHANCPVLPSNRYVEFRLYEDVKKNRLTYALNPSMVADGNYYFKTFDASEFTGVPNCLPPFLVLWYDGKPDGDFVSQLCLTVPRSAATKLAPNKVVSM